MKLEDVMQQGAQSWVDILNALTKDRFMKLSDYYTEIEKALECSGYLKDVPRRINIYDDAITSKEVQTSLRDTGICIVVFFLESSQSESAKNSMFKARGSFVFAVIENPATHAAWKNANVGISDARHLSALELSEALLIYISAMASVQNCQINDVQYAKNPIQRVKADEGQVRFNVEFLLPVDYSATEYDFDVTFSD